MGPTMASRGVELERDRVWNSAGRGSGLGLDPLLEQEMHSDANQADFQRRFRARHTAAETPRDQAYLYTCIYCITTQSSKMYNKASHTVCIQKSQHNQSPFSAGIGNVYIHSAFFIGNPYSTISTHILLNSVLRSCTLSCSFWRAHTQLPSPLEFLFGRFAIQPEDCETDKSDNDAPQTSDPRPRTGDGPRSRPLVMCKVAHRDLVLLLDRSQEGPLVVDFESEDTMLVGCRKSGAKHGAVQSGGGR